MRLQNAAQLFATLTILLGPAAPGQPRVLLAAPWAPARAELRVPVAENPPGPDLPAAGLVESLSCIIGSRLYLPVVVRGGAAALAPAEQSGPPAPGGAAPTIEPERDPWANGVPSGDFASAHAFLYTGSQPRQTGMQPDVINPTQAAVLRGRVCTRNGAPLPGVTISILTHPEFGSTLSLADGSFDLAVNGGATLTINYVKSGFLEAQRQAVVPWLDYAWLDRVVLIPLDSHVTAINLAQTGMQVARGSAVADGDGARQATLLVPPGTTAEMVMPNGSTQSITNLSVRATEYTVGLSGPAAMPGQLPPSSGYTYAVEYSVDQAQAAGAVEVRFSQPLIHYMENFLNFPVGMVVPTGWYDRRTGAWVPSENGRVVKIISVSGGLANLDTDGDGVADNSSALGITSAERQRLAALYQPGQTLWRVPIKHFSPWDCNWPYGPGPGASAPNQSPPANQPPEDQPACTAGSIIECQNQILGESIALVGTPFSLHYSSDRVPGRYGAYHLQFPLSGASPPASLARIDLTIDVAGRRFTQSFSAAPNQTTSFTWDGFDAYSQTVISRQPVTVRVGYVYAAVYQTPNQLGDAFAAFSGVPMSGNSARQEITLWQVSKLQLGGWDNRAQGLGGWNLDVHHAYDPVAKVLFLGDGSRRSANSLGTGVINTFAGGGNVPGPGVGDGGLATDAELKYPAGLAVGVDGSVYIADEGLYDFRRVDPLGVITTVAGTNGVGCFPFTAPCGDGGPAIAALLNIPADVAVGPDGSLYIADRGNNRIRRVAPDGIITTVAGTGEAGFGGDGGPATAAKLDAPYGVDIGPDGSLYIADTGNNRIRKVGPDGIIHTVAGTAGGPAGDGGPAGLASLASPGKVKLGPDGSLYILDSSNHRVRRVGPDGIINTVAGNGLFGYSGDGGPATQASLAIVEGLAVGVDGSLYIADGNRVRWVGPDGVINTIAGSTDYGFTGDGGPATRARLSQTQGVALGPDGRLYVGDMFNYRVRVVTSALPGFSVSDLLVPSEDGRELYVFNGGGRHLRTLNALTGAVLYQFAYDPGFRLTSVTDGDGNVTTITRNGSGIPTAIVGPYGHSTSLALNAAGYLTSVTDPLGQAYAFTYQPGGLLASLTDPRGQAYTFTYDALGRLTNDQDPAGGHKALNRIGAEETYSVTVTTALGHATQYQVQSQGAGEARTIIGPDGLADHTTRSGDGVSTWAGADGRLQGVTLGPDPRWGMLAPVFSSATLSTTGGLLNTMAVTRTASLTDSANVLSLNTLTEVLNVNGRTVTSLFKAANKTITTTTPAGRVTVTTVDAQGRPVLVQVAGLLPISYSYDSQGRLTAATQGSGPDTRTNGLAYGSQGLPISSTNALTQTSAFGYDGAGRLTQTKRPDGQATAFTYDANGNLNSLTPPGRPAHSFSYTPVDLLAQYSPPDVNPGADATQYTYNADRQLVLATRPDGQTVSYGYDSAGRPATVTSPRGTTSYSYNPTTGKLATVNAPGGVDVAMTYDGELNTAAVWSGPVAGAVGYSYDNNFRLAGSTVNAANLINYLYDPDGLLVQAGALSLTRSAQNGLLLGSTLASVTTTLGYSGFGEVLSQTAAAGVNPLYAANYSRDRLGRITGITETIGGLTDGYGYSYDLAGRLTGVTKNGPPIAAYTYDSNGNRLSFNGSGGPVFGNYDNQDRLALYGTATYSYTANGERLTRIDGLQITAYKYDVLGNLITVTLPDATKISYLIDGLDRRVGRLVNGAQVQGWLYQDDLRPIAELNGSNQVVSRFVYGASGNVPDYMVNGGATYRLLTDHVGSVRLVVNAATGAVAQRLDYDAFGRVLTDTSPGFQPFGFAGGLYDPATRLVRFGARDYDAETGTWLARDPLLFDSGQTNLYSYVNNDPVNGRDPQGLDGPKLKDFNEAKDALKKAKERVLNDKPPTPREETEILNKQACKSIPAVQKQGQSLKDAWKTSAAALEGY